jgi:hypothetical protein
LPFLNVQNLIKYFEEEDYIRIITKLSITKSKNYYGGKEISLLVVIKK